MASTAYRRVRIESRETDVGTKIEVFDVQTGEPLPEVEAITWQWRRFRIDSPRCVVTIKGRRRQVDWVRGEMVIDGWRRE